MRSARWASCSLWVTKTMVWPKRSRNSKKRSCSRAAFSESKFPEGSSANSTLGAFIKARATATRYLDALAESGILEKHRLGRESYYVNRELVDLLFRMPPMDIGNET